MEHHHFQKRIACGEPCLHHPLHQSLPAELLLMRLHMGIPFPGQLHHPELVFLISSHAQINDPFYWVVAKVHEPSLASRGAGVLARPFPGCLRIVVALPS